MIYIHVQYSLENNNFVKRGGRLDHYRLRVDRFWVHTSPTKSSLAASLCLFCFNRKIKNYQRLGLGSYGCDGLCQ